MIVDDDDLCRDMTARILKHLGASEVAELADGPAALAWAESDHGRLDLIVCDLRMPQVDGIETLSGLAARAHPRTFVLASAADPRLLRAAAETASRSGIESLQVVSKPVTLDKMAAVVAAMQETRPVVEQTWDAGAFIPAECSTKLVRGIANGEFAPFFQPKVDAVSGRICGTEAHLRWLSPAHGLLAPENFISVAQSIGFLEELFFAIFPLVVINCAEWRRRGNDFGVSINIPPPVLTSRDLPRRLEDMVVTYGLDPKHITLEVTEDVWVKDQDLARDVLTRLRVREFGLAIDDFGVGYSTFKQLLDAPFNQMKIARTFVQSAPTDSESAIVMSSSVALAQKLDMIIVAEGVETAAQRDFAAGVGCRQVQGSLIAEAMSADHFDAWLSRCEAATGRMSPASEAVAL